MNVQSAIKGFSSKVTAQLGEPLSQELTDYVINIFSHQIKHIEDLRNKVDRLKEELEKQQEENYFKKHKCVPVEKRFFEIEIVQSSTSKFTINPETGRMTIKLSHKTTEATKSRIISFIMDRVFLCDKFVALTYRGKFTYSHTHDQFSLRLMTENKKYVISFFEKPSAQFLEAAK